MQYGGQHSCFIFGWELQMTWLNNLINARVRFSHIIPKMDKCQKWAEN